MLPFDDRDGSIWYNGEIIPWRDAKVHILSHGLHYGSSVFEGERSYNGRIFKRQEHHERLISSGKLLGFDIPYTIDELHLAAQEVMDANGIVDGYLRPVAWRGSEMMAVSAPKITYTCCDCCLGMAVLLLTGRSIERYPAGLCRVASS